MRKYFVLSILIICFAIFSSGPAFAGQAEEVQSMVEKAASMIKEKGRDYTLKLLNARGPFTKGTLYVYALSMDNVVLAHPFNKDLVGKDMTNLKDTKGKLFIQEMVAKAKDPGYGWVEYYWKRHGEKDGTLKRAYTLGMPNENLYLAAGYYME